MTIETLKNGFQEAKQAPRDENCDTHGPYVSNHIFMHVWQACPVCTADKKAIKEREDEEKEAFERVRLWKKKLGNSGIPERFHSRTLDSYIASNAGQRSALAFAKEFAEGFAGEKSGRCAIFCGKPGTGKTHLSVGIGLHAMTLNKMVLFTTVQRMVRRVKDSWKKDSNESEGEIIALYAQPDLLIIDEIGVQFGTEFEKNFMFDILNERYENSMPSLLLSNLTATEVKAFLGERVFDRLREDGGKCIPFDWQSHRGQE